MSLTNLFRLKRTRIQLNLTDEQIDQLRAVVDGLPLDPYASLVVAVLKQLSLSDAAPPTGADADRRDLHAQGPGGGFSLHAFTPKGKAALPHLTRVLGELEVVNERLPHGDSL